MDKYTYMNELRKALQQFDNTTIEEVIGDYEEHFAMGLQYGRSEEQICEELGSIEELVREIAALQIGLNPNGQGSREGQNNPNGQGSREGQNNPNGQGSREGQNNPNGQGSREGQNNPNGQGSREGQHNPNGQNSGGQYNGNGQNAQNQQNGQYRQSGQTGPNTGESDIGCRKVEIEGICADIIVNASTDSKIHVTYENYGTPKQQMMYEFYSRQEGDVLKAGINKRTFSSGLFWQILGNMNMKIYLQVPPQMESIRIRSLSGDSSVQDVSSRELFANSASGDITVRNIQAARGTFQTLSGDVMVENVSIEQAEWNTKSGDVTGTGVMATSLRAGTLSGNAVLRQVKAEDVAATSTSGNAKVEDARIDRLECKSLSGNASADGIFQRAKVASTSGDVFLRVMSDVRAELSSISGNANLILENNGNGYEGNFSSVSGNIDIRYSGESYSFRRKCHYGFGNRGSEVNMKSTSGDVRLRD